MTEKENTNQPQAEIEKAGVTFFAAIPQIFFDMIARVIPGCAIFVIYVITFAGLLPETKIEHAKILLAPQLTYIFSVLHDNGLIAFFLICLALAFFYVVSLIFYSYWEFFQPFLLGYLEKCFYINERYQYAIWAATKDKRWHFSSRYEYIKLHAPAAGSRITKLKAEAQMSGTLASAFMVLFMVSCMVCQWKVFLILIFTGLFMIISSLNTTKRQWHINPALLVIWLFIALIASIYLVTIEQNIDISQKLILLTTLLLIPASIKLHLHFMNMLCRSVYIYSTLLNFQVRRPNDPWSVWYKDSW